MNNNPFRENSNCPVDHTEIADQAYKKGVSVGKRSAVKSQFLEMIEAMYKKLMDCLFNEGTLAVTLAIIFGGFIYGLSKMSGCGTPQTRCIEYRQGYQNQGTECWGHIVKEGDYDYCRCPLNDLDGGK